MVILIVLERAPVRGIVFGVDMNLFINRFSRYYPNEHFLPTIGGNELVTPHQFD